MEYTISIYNSAITIVLWVYEPDNHSMTYNLNWSMDNQCLQMGAVCNYKPLSITDGITESYAKTQAAMEQVKYWPLDLFDVT